MLRMNTTSPGAKLAALLAAAVMATLPAHGAFAADPRVEGPGTVVIYSTTSGATVEIDGKPQGVIPIADPLVVPAGQHTIKVSLRGWTDYLDTFTVAPGEEVELEIDLIPFAGIVKINTKQPGATVKIDGKVEGVTPFDKDIPVGKRMIAVGRPGYLEEVRELMVKPGVEMTVDLELRVDPNAEVASSSEFYEQWWFWTIVGVAVAGGTTAAVLGTSGGETAPPTAAFTLQVP